MANEKTNLWLYSSQSLSAKAAGSMISFGAEVFKRAKIVRDVELLDEIFKNLSLNKDEPNDGRIYEFIFEYVVDCVRILIFFENYMKGELIAKGFCVHQIDRDVVEFMGLAKQQFKRPVSLAEIEEVNPFIRNEAEKKMTHQAIKNTTIGMKELLGFEYAKHYEASDSILQDVRVLNATRNELHFMDTIKFQLFSELAHKIRRLTSFVDRVIETRITFPNK